MKLTGIIEDVFRGVTIFRGYATLKVLARYSKPTDYQRDKNDDRVKDISSYLKNSSFIFFPELIFGWQLDNADAIRQLKEEQDTSVISLGNNIKIRKAKFRFKSLLPGEEPKTKVVTIEIPDIFQGKIFSRIDGNHRLSVVDQIYEEKGFYDDDVCNQVVPFCVLIQNTSDEATKYESAYFYLINSKAISLTSEENLKSLMAKNLFSEIEKIELLSLDKSQLYYINAISDYLEKNTIDFIKEVFNYSIYTFSYELVKAFAGKVDTCIENVISSIKYVNSLYVTKNIQFCNQDILWGLTEVHIVQPNNFEKFLSWINKNEVGSIDKLKFEHIIQLFNSINKQRLYKIFVAMPYISFKRVNEYNILFKEALLEISKKIGFGLELIPIMRFRGESQRIDRRLIDSIKECDIFIGDLTTVNDNVIFEVGLAEGNNKKILLIKAEEDTKQLPFDKASQLDKDKVIPFDMDKLQYIPYSSSGYYNDIKAILRNNLPVIVNQLKKELHV